MRRLFRVLSVCIVVCLCLPMSSVLAADQDTRDTGTSQLSLEAAVICWDVINRECIDEGSKFSPTVGKLFCLTKVVGAREKTSITHVWYYGDTERARVTLSVETKSWRTYSSKIIQPHEKGSWHIDILDSHGATLGTVNFEIGE